MFKYSKSLNIKGSHSNSYRVNATQMVYGKGTTYGFNPVEVATLQEVIVDMLYGAVSPYTYKDGYRNKNNILSVGNLIILDVDSKTDILIELTNSVRAMPFSYFIIPTQNHLVNGYKYRLVIPINNTLEVKHYASVIKYLVESYNIPAVDVASKSMARFFAPTVPLVGQTFSFYDAPKDSDAQPTNYIVTQSDVDMVLTRTSLLNEQGELWLNPTLYPYQFTDILTLDEGALIYAPEDEVNEDVKGICGTTLTELYKDGENTLNADSFKMYYEQGEVCIGDVVSSLTNNQRVMCKCPTSDLHTDSGDKRYAWVLKTGGGRVRLYCSSNTCITTHGEYRDVVMPQWEHFVHHSSLSSTKEMIKGVVDTVSTDITRLCTEALCKLYNAHLDGEWHEKEAFAKEKLFADMLDLNTLYILCMLVHKPSSGALQVHTISPAGSRKGIVSVDSTFLQPAWFSYLFKPKWNELFKIAGDKAFSKTAIMKMIINKVGSNKSLTNLVYESVGLNPNQKPSNIIQLSYNSGMRAEYIVSNSFDEETQRVYRMYLKDGVREDTRYNGVINEFIKHWALPRGSVMLRGFEVNNIVDLLILASMLNLYGEGTANQRHTGYIITAPSSMGKTSLLNNFARVGLSNSDIHMADVFGCAGLYPLSIEDMKNKLWITGDELNSSTMRNMKMATLMSNLTRLDVVVNVKGKIDQSFSGYSKVIWGARAYETISKGNQSHELRNRLFAITYSEVNQAFFDLCEVDDGYIDRAIQLFICERYFAYKALIKNIGIKQCLNMFNEFRTALKAKYAGVIEEVYEDVEVEVINEAGEVEIVLEEKVELKIAKTDFERNALECIEVFYNYNQLMRGDVSRRVLYSENVMGSEAKKAFLQEMSLVSGYLVLPNAGSSKGYTLRDYYVDICEYMFKESKAYYMIDKFEVGAVKKALKKFVSGDMSSLSNRHVRKKSLNGVTSAFNTRGASFIALYMDKLDKEFGG